MSELALRKYAQITPFEFFHLAFHLLLLPVVLLWLSITNAIRYQYGRTIRRNVGIGLVRWFTDTFNIPQTQFLLPGTTTSCSLWSRLSGIPVSVETLIEDTSLIWIGPKMQDKPVILCIPGGALVYPVLPSHLDFWQYVRVQLSKSNRDVNVAILDYTLYPTAIFPTQLQQALIAVEHLITTGVHPSNLHIVGDSAGAQLILALASHSVQPLQIQPSISSPNEIPKQLRRLKLSAPIRSFYLMSPCVCLSSQSPSYLSNVSLDVCSTKTFTKFGENVLSHIDDAAIMPYLEPVNVPQGWFEGLGHVVERVLISAGDGELFRDDIIRFAKILEAVPGELNPKNSKGKGKRLPELDFRFIIHEGVHDDPLVDFMVLLPKRQFGSITKAVVEWLKDGIEPFIEG